MRNPLVPTQVAATLIPQPSILADISAFFGITSSPISSYGADVVGGEIYNLMSTLVGDECFEPTYGSDLPLRVFEPINGKVEAEVRSDVYLAMQKWIPQITLDNSQTAVFASADNRLVGIEVAYAYAGAGWSQSVPLTQAALNASYNNV